MPLHCSLLNWPGSNTQTIDMVASLNVSKGVPENAVGPDYAEIKDELCTEKSSEKLHQEVKSLELTKSSNHYFILEHPPQEEHESISNV